MINGLVHRMKAMMKAIKAIIAPIGFIIIIAPVVTQLRTLMGIIWIELYSVDALYNFNVWC